MLRIFAATRAATIATFAAALAPSRRGHHAVRRRGRKLCRLHADCPRGVALRRRRRGQRSTRHRGYGDRAAGSPALAQDRQRLRPADLHHSSPLGCRRAGSVQLARAEAGHHGAREYPSHNHLVHSDRSLDHRCAGHSLPAASATVSTSAGALATAAAAAAATAADAAATVAAIVTAIVATADNATGAAAGTTLASTSVAAALATTMDRHAPAASATAAPAAAATSTDTPFSTAATATLYLLRYQRL